ncbi:MAG TPA: Phenylacetic acid catabolic protein [Candidatus Kapabacteria bacterium]|jgi:ring-1,2-phenylacetyl-CoA epoxidase subunit PaaA|nr:Phenylacetic acid catabolic protein [Candidatus Kapabacteria bacterium]
MSMTSETTSVKAKYHPSQVKQKDSVLLGNDERTLRMNEKLAKGEKIEDHNDMSDEYFEHLTNLMNQQADSELAGAFGYVPWIQKAPSVEEMLIVSNITRDEVRHARAMYRLLEDLGIATAEITSDKDYTLRLDSNADIGADRAAADKRVNIFYYPIDTWYDFVMFNFLMDRGAGHQLEDVKKSSYGPWSREIERIFKEEMTHVGHGEYWVKKLATDSPETKAQIQKTLEKWFPRTMNIFGKPGTKKNRRYRELGLKLRDNAEVRDTFAKEVKSLCDEYGLDVPEWIPDWEQVPEEAHMRG